MKSQAGKKAMRKSRAESIKGKRNFDTDKSSGGNWKKKMKKALKTPHGLKSVMSVLAEEEKTNQGLISALNTSATTLPPLLVQQRHFLSTSCVVQERGSFTEIKI